MKYANACSHNESNNRQMLQFNAVHFHPYPQFPQRPPASPPGPGTRHIRWFCEVWVYSRGSGPNYCPREYPFCHRHTLAKCNDLKCNDSVWARYRQPACARFTISVYFKWPSFSKCFILLTSGVRRACGRRTHVRNVSLNIILRERARTDGF